MDRNELPFEPRHIGVPSGASKMISEAMVHLVHTVHLSCTETNIVSKRTETSFHLSLITHEYLTVHLKPFLSLWSVWRKPCTYLAPKLTLSPNVLKGDSTWPTSPRSSIECVQNDFLAYGTYGANHAPIMHRNEHCLQIDRNELPFEPHHLGVTSGASKTISQSMVRMAQTMHLSCTETNSISKRTERTFYMTHVT
jgi:hypothetical protein